MSAENWLKAELDRASKEIADWPAWKREAMKVTGTSDATARPASSGSDDDADEAPPEE